jgi:hypothetical protein
MILGCCCWTYPFTPDPQGHSGGFIDMAPRPARGSYEITGIWAAEVGKGASGLMMGRSGRIGDVLVLSCTV